MNGQQLAEEAKRQRPDLRVLLTTGYARNAILRHGKVDAGIQLITKPFSFTGLAAKIRSVLDMPARSGRILLVEDELLIQMLAVDQLESLGFKVETAASATEAMRKISGDLDAAIVDVGLPDRRGDVLIGEMRALHPSMPIVIASGYGEAALQKQFANDKRIAFLAKPYATNQLKAALESLNVER
jgi:DNA-binding NtrC family response regulator